MFKGTYMRHLIIVVSLLLMGNSLYAQERINVWAEHFPPFGYTDESGKIVGLSTDIIQHIAIDSGMTINSWRIAPWARAFKETQRSPNSILYTVVGNSERRKTFHLIGPVSDRNQYLYKLKSRKDIVVNSIEDAKKYVIGAVYGTAITDLLLSKGLKPHKVAKHDQTVKMLLKGRIDLVVHLDYSLACIAKSLGEKYSTFEPVLLVDGSKKYYIAINKYSSPSVIENFENSFKKLKNSGALSKIQEKYLN